MSATVVAGGWWRWEQLGPVNNEAAVDEVGRGPGPGGGHLTTHSALSTHLPLISVAVVHSNQMEQFKYLYFRL